MRKRNLWEAQFHCGWWSRALHALCEARRELKSPRASPLLSTYQAASDAERFEYRSDIASAQVDGSMNQGGWRCELPTLVSSDSEIPASSRLGSRWNRCSRTRSCC